MLSRPFVIAALAALPLAGCSGPGGFGGLQTGSTPAPEPAFVDNAQARVMQTALTSVTAEKCGFNVDQARLKTSYLTYEAASGTSSESLASIDRSYDKIRSLVRPRVLAIPDLCSEARVSEIRTDVTRYLAGDFSAKPRKAAVVVEAPMVSATKAMKEAASGY